MRYSLANLRTFAAVAELRSITLAGEKLGRTPSTVSMALKALEEEIGAPLFESERKNRLSKAGMFVLAEARDLLSHHERSMRTIQAFVRNQSGRVDVACVPSVATSILPQVLLDFRKRHPGVEINVRDADSPSVTEAVENGKVALGIASSRRPRPELNFEPLFEERLGIVCRDDDPLTEISQPIHWTELSGRSVLGNGISSGFAAAELGGLLSDAPIVVHNVLSLLALVRAGMGITMLPRLSIDKTPSGLAFLPLADPAATRTVGLVTRSIERNSPAEEAFVAELRRSLLKQATKLRITLL